MGDVLDTEIKKFICKSHKEKAEKKKQNRDKKRQKLILAAYQPVLGYFMPRGQGIVC